MSLSAIEPTTAKTALPPKNPTISAVTPLWQGVFQQQNKDLFSGVVTEVKQEDVLPEGAIEYPSRRTTTLKFDDDGHLIESTYHDSLGTTTVTNEFQNGRLQSRTTKHHRADGRFADWQEWEKWSYDRTGRVSGYRAGSNDKENSHYLNLKYDTQGRMLGYEFRQNGSEQPFSFTEFKYEGKTITTDQFDQNHHKIFEQVQVLDAAQRVIELCVSDTNNGALKLWYHSKFKYDERHRLTEQNTDQYNYAPGDENSEPPPGRVAVLYDDKNHSGEQDFFDADGKFLVRMTAEFDSHGYVTKLETLDAAGKQLKASEGIWVDPKTHKTHPGTYTSEAKYDDHGNWTQLRSWFAPADGGDRILLRSITQTITYR